MEKCKSIVTAVSFCLMVGRTHKKVPVETLDIPLFLTPFIISPSLISKNTILSFTSNLASWLFATDNSAVAVVLILPCSERASHIAFKVLAGFVTLNPIPFSESDADTDGLSEIDCQIFSQLVPTLFVLEDVTLIMVTLMQACIPSCLDSESR